MAPLNMVNKWWAAARELDSIKLGMTVFTQRLQPFNSMPYLSLSVGIVRLSIFLCNSKDYLYPHTFLNSHDLALGLGVVSNMCHKRPVLGHVGILIQHQSKVTLWTFRTNLYSLVWVSTSLYLCRSHVHFAEQSMVNLVKYSNLSIPPSIV